MKRLLESIREWVEEEMEGGVIYLEEVGMIEDEKKKESLEEEEEVVFMKKGRYLKEKVSFGEEDL